MKRIAVVLGVAGIVLSASAEEISRRHFRFSLEPEVPVRINVEAAALRIEPGDGDDVETELVVRCTGQMSACEAAAKEVSVGSFDDGGPVVGAQAPDVRGRGPVGERTGDLELEGRRSTVRTCSSRCVKQTRTVRSYEAPLLRTNRWQLALDLAVRYPSGRRLEIDAGEGSLELLRLASNARVRLERGSAKVTVYASRLGNVRLASRDGKVRLLGGAPRLTEGESRDAFDSYLEHSGKGPVHVDVEVRRGDVTLELL